MNDPVNETLTFRSSEIPRLNFPLPPTHESGLFSSVSETFKDISQRISGRNDNILPTFNNYIFDEAATERFYSFKNSVSKPEDVWKTYVLNEKMEQLVNVVLTILPVSASETAVERKFSKQKLVLSDLRTRSKSDLVDARFILTE